MQINTFVSDKIKVLSFFSILLVLYIHSGFHTFELNGTIINVYVQTAISGRIGRCAVPLFFMISGYLFFYKGMDGLESVFKKMKSRIRTLLVPYLCAAAYFFIFSYGVAIIPGTSKFMNSPINHLFDLSLVNILKTIFIDAGNGNPLAFQLWFLKELMIIVLFAPIWYLLIKYLKYYWLPVVLIISLFEIPYFPFSALFWFILGTSVKHIDLETKYTRFGLICLGLFILICLLEFLFPTSYWKYFQKPIILMGVFGIWSVYNFIVPPSFSLQRYSWLATASSFTFFTYLYHEPTLNVFRKTIVFLLGKDELGYLISYLTSPWIYMVFSIAFGLLLRNYVPRFYNIIVGGRS